MPEIDQSKWAVDQRQHKDFGPYGLDSLRQKGGGEGAHLVSFPDGRGIRVLGDNNGRVRYVVLVSALEALNHLNASSAVSEGAGFDPLTYLVGVLVEHGLRYERIVGEVTIEAWLTEWFLNDNDLAPAKLTEFFLDDLKSDGWQIVRRDTE